MRKGRALRVGMASIAAGVVVVAGCGSDYLPPGYGSVGPATGVAADAAASFRFDAASLAPPGCGVGPDGGVCDCIDSPLLLDPPNFYFVLDRSGSMAEADKWTTVRVAVSEIMQAIGPRASFGATIFPGNAGGCSSGSEIMSLRPGDAPSGTFGPTTRFLVETTRQTPPAGGTPTAPTLAALADKLPKLPGKTYVLLATDGGPNCAKISCGADTCMLNIESLDGCRPGGASCCNDSPTLCLDGDATVAAVSKLKAGGVPTFVIGVPGSQAYGSLLDRLAVAGGTEQAGFPAYYRVDKTDKADLVAALRKVAAKIVATCTYELKEAPPDASRVNVYLDEIVVPKKGWKLDGKTVTLVDETCDRVLRGDVLDVRIILGCPTVDAR